MKRWAWPAIAITLANPVAGSAQALCQLCDAPVPTAAIERAERPLRINIESILDFSVAARTGGQTGHIAIDPRGGAPRLSPNLVDIAGLTFKATVRITGDPMRRVRVDLPVSVELRSSGGGVAQLTDIVSDLSAMPQLDGAGVLVFSFGGRLLTPGDASGDFRGRVPVTAEYE